MSISEIRRNERRLRLSLENLAALKVLRRENVDWSLLPLNKFVNYVIADGIRVRLLATGKPPTIGALLTAEEVLKPEAVKNYAVESGESPAVTLSKSAAGAA